MKYQFTHETLPEETMYIFDGTAMLFASHFMSSAAIKSKKPAVDTDQGTPAMVSVPALLSSGLNAKIVASMSDEQIADMLNTFAKLDNENEGTTENLFIDKMITADDRAQLQLRCEPLVAMLFQFARLVRDIKPKYVAVAFDAGRQTFRKDLFPSYKMQRKQVYNLEFYIQLLVYKGNTLFANLFFL